MTEVILLDESEPLDLDATLGCGQTFRWRQQGGWWEGVADGRFIRLRQCGPLLHYAGANESFVRHYLALDLDLDRALSAIDHDPVIREVIEYCRGLRIVRQPLFECLLSYLCATNTNIPAVRSRVEAIATAWGEPATGSASAYAFPEPQALREATEEHLGACRLGYRAPYARSTIATICDTPSWKTELLSLPHEEARARLMALPGIGPKAADCVLLYGMGHLDAFPVDVWIYRILRQFYRPGPDGGPLSPLRYETLRAFGRRRFGPYAGYAQVYLYNARHLLCSR